MIIAIDGPAGSGKGTIAREVASHYDITHLDSGLLYRALAYKAGLISDLEHLIPIAKSITRQDLFNPELKTEEMGSRASVLAIIPEVRKEFTHYIRRLCEELPGIVIDGRDIGTVVCPHADVKLYITARTDIRVARRILELKKKDENEAKECEKLLKERDLRDQFRGASPLTIAEAAFVIDTSDLKIEECVEKSIQFIKAKMKMQSYAVL